MPDPILIGRNPDKIAALAQQYGVTRWATDLDKALLNPDDEIFFDAGTTQMRPELLEKAIDAGKHVYCEKPIATNLDEALDGLRARRKGRRQERRGAGQAVPAGPDEARRCCAIPASSAA